MGWGVTLVSVTETSGFSAFTRWSLGGLVLVVSAVVMSELVAGRRATESERERLQLELEHLAHHDPLTGLANRRLFEKELDRELSRAVRQGQPLSLVALDLDGFKDYNDAHGHVAGDRQLKAVAAAWSEALRSEDLLARLGGDEFVALLPDCPAGEAERIADRLSQLTPSDASCSTGVAVWDGEESAEELLARADRAMYRKKKLLAVQR